VFFYGQKNKYQVPIIIATGPIDGAPNNVFAQIHSDGENMRIVVRDYFYSVLPFSTPYITHDSHDSATLHIDIKKKFSLISSKCEFQRQIVILIPMRLTLNRTHLLIENHDTDHVMTVNLDAKYHKNGIVFDEEFIEAQVAC
jgi:hypothetical protein